MSSRFMIQPLNISKRFTLKFRYAGKYIIPDLMRAIQFDPPKMCVNPMKRETSEFVSNVN